ncbi:MAG: lytic transglycosylase domain-containing protein [Salinivirgaceae bacterium]|nr:lytic transglycosylase domain-containing protein [Salinivirgaceae bacterium]
MTINKTLLTTTLILLISFVLLVGFSFNTEEPQRFDSIQEPFNLSYQIKPLDIPESVFFAGEKVPIESFDVLESLDKELLINTYWQSQTLLFIKRANRFFPIIEAIFEQEGVPADFKYLALVESGLTNVVSPSDAAGYWQFLKGTAQDYKLEVNDEIDERYHIEKSTEAAAKFLKDSYEKFGNWAMAAASYNTGRRSLSRQIERQKSNKYYDLTLGEETGRYVYRLIALKLILESPEKYGFFVEKDQMYPEIPFKNIKVDSTVHDWADFAHSQGINYKTLKELNPWLRDNTLTNNSNKTYQIKIPTGKHRTIDPNPEFYPEDSLLRK